MPPFMPRFQGAKQISIRLVGLGGTTNRRPPVLRRGGEQRRESGDLISGIREKKGGNLEIVQGGMVSVHLLEVLEGKSKLRLTDPGKLRIDELEEVNGMARGGI